MGKDKGKARKSLSSDKLTDRYADMLLTSRATGKDYGGKPVADALRARSTKKNISPKKRQSYQDAAALFSGPPSLKGK